MLEIVGCPRIGVKLSGSGIGGIVGCLELGELLGVWK